MLSIYRSIKYNLQTSIYPPILIATCHLGILTFQTYEIIVNFINLENLVDLHQIIYIVLITALQIAVIALLCAGTLQCNHALLLPWLCFTAPIFVMVTTYVGLYLPIGDHIQNVINFVFVGLFWCAWYTVCNHYLYIRTYKDRYGYINYKYSQLSNIDKVTEKIQIKKINLLV